MKYYIKTLCAVTLLSVLSTSNAQTNFSSNTITGGWSSALGVSNVVPGSYSLASGYANHVAGNFAFASGVGANVSGVYSASIGVYSVAGGTASYSIGNRAKALTAGDFAIGSYAEAKGTHSYVFGEYSIVDGYAGYAFGRYSGGTGDYGFSIGNFSSANASSSYAIGEYVSTSATGAFTIGKGLNSSSRLNNGSTNSLMVGFNSDQPTFYVGASAGSGTTGNVGIGTAAPNSKLTVNGKVEVGREGVVGTYNSTQVQGIWSLGSAYGISTAANDFGTQYGMVYAHTNAGTSGSKKPIAGWGHQILFTDNGNRKAAISTSYGHAYFEGNMGIGTENTQGYKLAVNGGVIAEEIVVKLYANWPDYVFGEKYALKPLAEVEEFIQENNHLPNVPSEKEVKDKGINLGEMDAILLQKIEELTLYTIEQQKLIEKQGELIEQLTANKK